MVGYRRQKLCVIAAVVSLTVLVVLYLYSFRKTSDAFKPFTALILASTNTRTHNVAGLQVVNENKRLQHQGYENSVPFDHVSKKCFRSLGKFSKFFVLISFCFYTVPVGTQGIKAKVN